MTDRAYASEAFGVGVTAPLAETGRERGQLLVAKYDQDMAAFVARKLGQPGPGKAGYRQAHTNDFDRWGIKPYETLLNEDYNGLVTGGWDRLLTLAIGGGGTAYASASTRIGVSTATAAFASGQTDLQGTGSANRQFNMVTGAGTVGTGTGVRRLSFVATFGTGEANFAWQEAGIDQGTSSGTAVVQSLLNRLVSNQGTKASGQTWTATFLLDFT